MGVFHIRSLVSSVFFFSVVSTSEQRLELGTRVFIIGTHQASNSSGVTNPWFQCLVDGESTSVVAPSLPENGLLFCEKDGLSVGEHQISVVVSVSNQQTFWFDYIQYLPTASVSLDNATLWINSTDSQIRYGTGWSSNDVGASTSQNAATLSFQFTGAYPFDSWVS